jgi:pimeloyl-ACP methyl ester carboxylesterase
MNQRSFSASSMFLRITTFFVGVFALVLSLPTFSPAADDDRVGISGDWAGDVVIGAFEMRVLFRIREYPNGNITAALSAPDKSELPVPVTVITRDDKDVRIDVDTIGGKYRGKLSGNGKRIRGEWTQGEYNVDLDLDFVEGGFAQGRPQTPKPPFDYAVEEVTFSNAFSNKSLAGTLSLPRSRPRHGTGHPAIVLVSDAGPHNRDAEDSSHRPFAVIADFLTKRGLAVLRYDDRGVGKSAGEHAFGTTADFATDAYSAVEFLKKRDDINSTKIGYLGHGEGALIATIASAKRDDIAFLVLLGSPGVRGNKTLIAQTDTLARVSGVSQQTRDLLTEFTGALYALLIGDPAAALAEAERLGAELQKSVAALPAEEAQKLGEVGMVVGQQIKSLESESPWLPRFVAYHPREDFEKLTNPILFLTGENDLETPAAFHFPAIEATFTHSQHKDFTLETLKGLNHRFQKTDNGAPSLYGTLEETFAPTALRTIGDWIDQRFR